MLESPRWTVARDTCVVATLFVAAAAATRAPPVQDAAPDASAWTVASQPRAIFGQSDDWPGGMFAGIVDVARAPDGTIVVAESQFSSVSFFSADGTLIATEGRQGEGPGEFSRISTLLADPEGGFFVFDRGHQRVSEYTLTGDFIGDAELVRGASDRPIGGVAQYDDGSWYVWEADHMVGSEIGEMARDTVGYYQFAGGEVGDLLARVPGTITSHFEFQGRGSVRHALLTPRPLGVVRGQCLLLGTSDAPVLHVLDQSGTGVGEVTLDIEVDRTTDEHRRQWASATRAGLSGLAGFIQGFSIRRMSRRVGMA
ncbi:MAG: 6-bladed beta-propeller [Gemmatimonadota bacterium]|nr:6-bladed beta-propeller [Gemmatimonadota bacterium]